MNRDDLLQKQQEVSNEFDKLLATRQQTQEQLDTITESMVLLRGEHRAFQKLIDELDTKSSDPASMIQVTAQEDKDTDAEPAAE